jgi:hypothetical protein
MDDHSRFVVGYGLHTIASKALALEVLPAGTAGYGPSVGDPEGKWSAVCNLAGEVTVQQGTGAAGDQAEGLPPHPWFSSLTTAALSGTKEPSSCWRSMKLSLCSIPGGGQDLKVEYLSYRAAITIAVACPSGVWLSFMATGG